MSEGQKKSTSIIQEVATGKFNSEVVSSINVKMSYVQKDKNWFFLNEKIIDLFS